MKVKIAPAYSSLTSGNKITSCLGYTYINKNSIILSYHYLWTYLIRLVHNYFRAFHEIFWVTNWVWAMMFLKLVEDICLQIKLKPFAMLLTFFSRWVQCHSQKYFPIFPSLFFFCPIISLYLMCYMCFLFMCFKNI